MKVRGINLVVVCAALLLVGCPSFAGIVMTTQTSGLGANSCSTTDLLQTAFGSFIGGSETDGRPTQREPILRNGVLNTVVVGDDNRYVAGAGNYVEYALDLTTNTRGYDLTGIDTYELWDTGRRGQNYNMLVSFASSPTVYQTLIPAAASPGGFVIGSSSVLDKVSFRDSIGGLLDNGTVRASGVARVRFNFANADTYNQNMYQEIDIFGSATQDIPEPITLSMLALAVGSVGAYIRRRR